jgi:hypothetical protein
LTVEATPQLRAGSVVVTARHETVKDIVGCFSAERLLLTGQIDIDAAFSTQGKIDELVRNLAGTVRVEVRDGLVMKFALLGNILSMKNIAGLLQKGTPQLGSEGFPYRRLLVKGHLDQGTFVVEEGVFDSSAVGLVTTGTVGIIDHQANLTVLVAPFTSLNRLVRAVPIIGYVLGGVLTSIPVGVHGDYTNPSVIPLGPRAVTSDLLGVFSRALKVPGKLVAPLESDSKANAQPAQP